MRNLKNLSIFFIVFFGVSVAFTMSGVRESEGMNPYAVDDLIAAASAVVSAFLVKAIRSSGR